MSRPPTTHNNETVRDILEHFVDTHELIGQFSAIDDILCGASYLKTEGDSATRSLVNVGLLFRLLQALPTISTGAIQAFMGPATGERTVRCYAAAARVASKGIEAWSLACTLTQAQRIAFIEALGPKVVDDPLDHIPPAIFGSGRYDPLKNIEPSKQARRWARNYRLHALAA